MTESEGGLAGGDVSRILAAMKKRPVGTVGPFLRLWFPMWMIYFVTTTVASVVVLVVLIFTQFGDMPSRQGKLLLEFARATVAEQAVIFETSELGDLGRRAMLRSLENRLANYARENRLSKRIPGEWLGVALALPGAAGTIEEGLPGREMTADARERLVRIAEDTLDGVERSAVMDGGIYAAVPVRQAAASPASRPAAVIAFAHIAERYGLPDLVGFLGAGVLNISLLLLLPGGAIAGFVFALALRRRIVPLRASAEGFLAGDFTVNKTGPSRDELGLLSSALARLGEGLPGLLAGSQERGVWEERSRIARELHDGLKQELFALSLNAGALARRPELGDGKCAAMASDLERGIGQALSRTQDMLEAFSPAIVTPENLGAMIAAELGRWKDSGRGFEETLDIDALPEDDRTANASFWIAREAIGNAAKHSGCSKLAARLFRKDGAFMLSIEDDGHGIAPSKANGRARSGATRERAGMGLGLMRSRAREAGGQVVMETREGGTTVLAVFSEEAIKP